MGAASGLRNETLQKQAIERIRCGRLIFCASLAQSILWLIGSGSNSNGMPGHPAERQVWIHQGIY